MPPSREWHPAKTAAAPDRGQGTGEPAQRLKSPKSPMTAKQASWLRELCEQAGREFDPSLSKREASEAIKQLRPGHLTAARVREVASCPWCGVEAGAYCRRKNGSTRRSNHERRVRLARRRVESTTLTLKGEGLIGRADDVNVGTATHHLGDVGK
jgi:hypothetical protein